MASNFDALWPFAPPSFVHVTGPRGVGKTLFAIGTGAQPSKIAFFDGEASAKSYNKQVNFGVYHNLVAETAEAYGETCTSVQYFLAVKEMIENLEPKYDVLVFDNILRFESGLVTYVQENPQNFGISKGQAAKMPALVWGPIKSLYSNLIVEWIAKVKMMIVTTPIGETWAHSKPTGVYKPKGKDVLEWLTGLRVWLQFRRGSKIPVGLVLKDRICKLTVTDSGIEMTPVLPRRICPCTWKRIREYMESPADMDHPEPEEELTDAEWRVLNGFLPKDKLLQLEVAKMELQAGQRAERDAKAENKGPRFADSKSTVREVVSVAPKNVAELIAKAFGELGLSLTNILEVAEVDDIMQVTDIAETWEKLQENVRESET